MREKIHKSHRKKASHRVYPGASPGIVSGTKRRDKPGGSLMSFLPNALRHYFSNIAYLKDTKKAAEMLAESG
jgi:hypothetical protein